MPGSDEDNSQGGFWTTHSPAQYTQYKGIQRVRKYAAIPENEVPQHHLLMEVQAF